MSIKHIIIDARIRRASTGRPIARLLDHLQELDTENKYTILTELDDDWTPTNPRFSKIPIGYRQFSFNPFQQMSFSRFLYSLKADLVHFTLTGQQPLFYFGKQITMTHDLTMLRFARAGRLPEWVHQLRIVAYRLLVWSGHRKAAQIATPTKFVKQDVMAHYPFTRGKVTVTNEAGSLPVEGPADAVQGVVKSDKFLLAVGTAFPHKNLESLVDAHKILLKKYPDLKLLFAGKKEYYYGLLDAYIEQNTNTKLVRTLGFVSDAELKWLYENCLAYIFPSLSEGWGLPPLEAMSYGAPVASSNATCMPEVLGDAALYFDPHSPADIAAKISELIENKTLRESLIKKGYLQAKKYSWRRMSEETLAVYNKVLK